MRFRDERSGAAEKIKAKKREYEKERRSKKKSVQKDVVDGGEESE